METTLYAHPDGFTLTYSETARQLLIHTPDDAEIVIPLGYQGMFKLGRDMARLAARIVGEPE